MEDVAAAQVAATEGKMVVLRGTRRGETEERRENAPADMMNWDRVVVLVSDIFGEGMLAEEAMLQELVLIPKGGEEYRGIGFVEVMWKVVAAILN